MDKVIIPIYPDETERKYNAHIKSRALAGCYEDKKWYGYSGSRNSGKGTETGILRNAFGDFVFEVVLTEASLRGRPHAFLSLFIYVNPHAHPTRRHINVSRCVSPIGIVEIILIHN